MTGPKLGTLKKHTKRKHQDLKHFDSSRKTLTIQRFDADVAMEKDSLTKMLNPQFCLRAVPF